MQEATNGRTEHRDHPGRLADAVRRQDPERIAEFLAPDLVWEGLEPGLRGPGFNGTPGDLETVGQICNVFTLSGGKVVRWRDYLTRTQALAAASASDPHWQ
jgi:hypothetical protein